MQLPKTYLHFFMHLCILIANPLDILSQIHTIVFKEDTEHGRVICRFAFICRIEFELWPATTSTGAY